MKKLVTILSFLLLVINTSVNAQSYKYDFKIKGAENDTIFLVKYYSGTLLSEDTTIADSKGRFSFKGDNLKPKGIYAILFTDKKTLFDVVLSERKFSVTASKNDIENTLKFKNSKENNVLYQYKTKLNNLGKRGEGLNNKMKNSKNEVEKKNSREKLSKLSKEIDNFRDTFFKENEKTLVGKLLKISIEPKIPKNITDRVGQFNYYKKHYFDNIDLSNDNIFRNPISVQDKIKFYIEKLTPQIPDSICSTADRLIKQTKEGGDIYRYIITFVTSNYERSKIMGMDAVFICMVDKYYSKGKAIWEKEENLENIIDSYKKNKNLILGKKATDIILPDIKGKWHSLFSQKAEYTLVYFWSPNCHHCKKTMVEIEKKYKEWNKKLGLKVFAVCSEFENETVAKFINEKKITFLSVSDSPEINENAWKLIKQGKTTLNSVNFRDYWQINTTPILFLLDKDKKIAGKKIGIENLEQVIEMDRKIKKELKK